MAALYGVLALSAAACLALVMGLFGVLPFLWLPRGRREHYTLVSAAAWARAVLQGLLFVRAEVDGHPPNLHTGALIVCNHRSWLDPILLMATTRSNGLSKAEIFWLPILGPLGWATGAVFFDRHHAEQRARARREVLALVRAGHRIQLFPEGTRTRTGALAERVHLGLCHDCFAEGLPVVCCAVWGTERVLPATELAAWPGQRVRLRIGRTLYPGDFADADQFAAACWAEVTHDVDQLRREETRPTPVLRPSRA